MKKSIKLLLIAICVFAVFFSACSKTVSTDEVKKSSDTDNVTENTENTENTESTDNTGDTQNTDNTQNTESTDDTENTNEPTSENATSFEWTVRYPKGDTSPCPAHGYAYHGFLSDLIDPLGEEFYEWIVLPQIVTEYDIGCKSPGKNIKAFIDRFDIPREEFEQACAMERSCVFDPDLLYSDNMEAIEAYFRDLTSREMTENKQHAFDDLKDQLLDDHSKNDVFAPLVSMFEVAELCNCSRSEIENAIQTLNKEHSYNITYNYNLDVLFDADGNLKPYDKSLGRVKLDEMFCGIDNWYTD